MVDLLDIKGRLALAFIESIFRRAGYALTPAGVREVPPHLGREDLPDFVARHDAPERGEPNGTGWLVGVRYRPRLTQYLAIEHQRGLVSLLAQLKRNWPDLIMTFFTDHAEPGCSPFQVVDLGAWNVGEAIAAIDLFAHPRLDIYRQNVEEHEELVRRVLLLFEGDGKFRRLG
jgi:hypothetical protein